jgi:hypothetical protein
VTKPVTDPICGQPGATQSRTTTTAAGGAVSVKGTIFGVDVTATGNFSGTETSTGTYMFGPGANGFGQCFSECKHFTVCAALYKVTRDGWHWTTGEYHVYKVTDPCAKVVFETAKCQKESATSGVSCDRTE